jgi:hypothetical protein
MARVDVNVSLGNPVYNQQGPQGIRGPQGVPGRDGIDGAPGEQGPAGEAGAHHAQHENGGTDEIATATSAANAIPKASAGGKLDIAWIPTGASSTTVAIGNDVRLSDSRVPTAHASSHNAGGGDALAIDAAAGTGSLRTLGTSSTAACAGNDSRLSDARNPVTHATSHKSGGSDAVKLDELAAPTDVTTLNASSTVHGLCPKLSNDTATFLRGDGTWVSAGSPNLPTPIVESGASANAVIEYGYAQTTDATVTTVLTYALADNTLYLIEATFTGRDQAGTHRCAYGRFAVAYRQGAGSATLQGSVQATFADVETSAGMDATIAVSGNNLLFRVTGLAGTTINWDLVACMKPRS